jgi:hypothetical protein
MFIKVIWEDVFFTEFDSISVDDRTFVIALGIFILLIEELFGNSGPWELGRDLIVFDHFFKSELEVLERLIFLFEQGDRVIDTFKLVFDRSKVFGKGISEELKGEQRFFGKFHESSG